MWKFISQPPQSTAAEVELPSSSTTVFSLSTSRSSTDIDPNVGSNSNEAEGSNCSPASSPSPSFFSRAWCSAVMASPNVWVLLGLGIGGIILIARSWSRKRITSCPELVAFIKRLDLLPSPQPAPPAAPHPLRSLTFAVQDIFDVEGHVTGFGSPDWERTHEPASRTSPAVSLLLEAGATCVGKTHMDEMAYSMLGQNKHYGTLLNPAAASCMPGGSSSGAAVAVAADLVDFALSTDTNGGIRIPAAFCGIMGFRPSHGAVSCIGVVPVSQSLDAVGWLARDPTVLCAVGRVLLQQPLFDTKQPKRVLLAVDCFALLLDSESSLMSVVSSTVASAFGKEVITRVKLGQYISSKIASLKSFKGEGSSDKGDCSGVALKSLREALQLLVRYKFKTNHGEWIYTSKPALTSNIPQDIKLADQASAELVADAFKVRNEMQKAFDELFMNNAILIMPTAPGAPPRLQEKEAHLVDYTERAFTLLSVASMSGCCQVSIPIGKQEGGPIAVSLIAKQGADLFLLETAKSFFPVLQKEAETYSSNTTEAVPRVMHNPEAAELAKEKGNVAFKKKDYRTALECYSEAIQFDETNSTYYSNRAAAYLALCSFHQAEVDCSKAIDLDRKNVKAYLRRGTAREYLGLHKDADEDFKQALILEPTNKAASDGIKRIKRFFLDTC